MSIDVVTDPVRPEVVVDKADIKFDPEPRREEVRAWIAQALVWLFIIEIIAAMIMFLIAGNTDPKRGFGLAFNDVKDIATLILGPTVALVGAATGFYYGGRSGGG